MLKKLAVIFLIVILMFSCYSHKIILNSDKNSGQMIIEYTLDDDYFQLISIASENFNKEATNSGSEDKFDPSMLIDKGLFLQSFKNTKEVKLKSIDIQSSNNVYRGRIVIEFYDLAKLIDKMPKGLADITLKKEGGDVTYTQIIDYKKMDPEGVFKEYVEQQKEDDIALYNRLTKEAKFSFVVTTATPIKKAEGVVLSGDKKRAEYTFKINDIINSTKVLKFLISL
jgi:hypothetical protein